jgi:hypothetical protein
VVTKSDSSSVIGQNWYEIFPALPRWKRDHAEAFFTQQAISNQLEHWEEQDNYLNWAIMPAGKYQIWSFIDLTELGRKTAEIARQRDVLIELGLGRINDV